MGGNSQQSQSNGHNVVSSGKRGTNASLGVSTGRHGKVVIVPCVKGQEIAHLLPRLSSVPPLCILAARRLSSRLRERRIGQHCSDEKRWIIQSE